VSPNDYPKDPEIEEFFKINSNFYCPKLRARILRKYCYYRMNSGKPSKTAYGPRKTDNILDSFCRSGKCPEGQETLKWVGTSEAQIEDVAKGSGNVQKPSGKKRRGRLSNASEASVRAVSKIVGNDRSPENYFRAFRWAWRICDSLTRTVAIGKNYRR
jgi:hypothetical protein